MLTREDIERITENVLRELSLDVTNGGFTDPNSRCVILKLGETEITRAYFDVKQQREYEG
jgi:hypothetical protein